MKRYGRPVVTVIALLLASIAMAKVSPEEAAKLGLEGTELTPTGAIRGGNADGTIPAWEGGIKTPPAGYEDGKWYVDPFADDKPLVHGDGPELSAVRKVPGAG